MTIQFIKLYTSGGVSVCTDVDASTFGALTAPWSEVQWDDGGDPSSAFGFFYPNGPYYWFRWDGVNPVTLDATDAAQSSACNATIRAIQLEPEDTIAIYDLVPVETAIGDTLTPPVDLDFDRSLASGLLKDLADVSEGEVRCVKRWLSSTGSALAGDLVYSGLNVQEDLAYIRDSGGYAKSRTRALTWMKKTGLPHASVKIKPKVYDLISSRNEGIKRREYHVASTEMDIIGLMRISAALDAASSLYGDSNSEVTRKGGALLTAMGETIPNFIRYDDELPMMARLTDPLDPNYVQAVGDLVWLDEDTWDVQGGAPSGVTFRETAAALLQPSFNAMPYMEDRFGEAGGTEQEKTDRIAAIRAAYPTITSDAAAWRTVYAWAQQVQDMLDAVSDPPEADEQEWLSSRDATAAWVALAANPPASESEKDATRDELTTWYATGSGAETDRRAARWTSLALGLEEL
jgi:hypothetical protein